MHCKEITGSFSVNYKKAQMGKGNLLNIDGESQEKSINYTRQSALADGWRLVLPKRNMVKVVKGRGNDKVETFENKILTNEVVISQLPPHLFRNLPEKVSDGVLDGEVMFDKFYKFVIRATPHDSLMRELYNMLLVKYPSVEEKSKMKDIVDILESNEIDGWLVFRAKNVIKG